VLVGVEVIVFVGVNVVVGVGVGVGQIPIFDDNIESPPKEPVQTFVLSLIG